MVTKCLFAIIFLLIIARPAPAADGDPARNGNSYSNANLGFRYLPPTAMQDVTERARGDIEAHAKALRTRNILGLLLAMTSGRDDTVAGWHSLTIETYPRSALPNLDDKSAEAKMNALVAHSRDASAVPRPVVISGQSFVVSVFGLQEGNVRKGAVVWTTIRKGQLLSFAFSANSPEQLTILTESMKTLQFF
jgi:hypothetical protein